MKRLLEVFDKSFVVFSLLYFTASLNFLGGVTPADNPALTQAAQAESGGGPILSLLQYSILGITLVLTYIRRRKIAYLASRRKILWMFVGFVLLSFLWSTIPAITLRKSIVFLFIILFGLNVSARYSLKDLLFLLSITMGIILSLNIVFTLALPWAAIETGEHQGAWRGIYIQKNEFARMMVLSALIFLVSVSNSSKRHSRFLWLGLGVSICLILLSTSKGALLIFVMLFVLLRLFKFLQNNHTIALPVSIIIFLLVGSTAIIFVENAESFARLLGRDITLTGRTGIWSVVISKIALHPWLGYGYKGFWRGMEGDSADVYYETLFMAPHAHNGFLDITVELGIIGLLLFLAMYLKNCVRGISWLRLCSTSEGLLPIMYLMFLFLYNLTENTLTDPNYFVWALYTAITTSMLVQPVLLSEYDSRLSLSGVDKTES